MLYALAIPPASLISRVRKSFNQHQNTCNMPFFPFSIVEIETIRWRNEHQVRAMGKDTTKYADRANEHEENDITIDHSLLFLLLHPPLTHTTHTHTHFGVSDFLFSIVLPRLLDDVARQSAQQHCRCWMGKRATTMTTPSNIWIHFNTSIISAIRFIVVWHFYVVVDRLCVATLVRFSYTLQHGGPWRTATISGLSDAVTIRQIIARVSFFTIKTDWLTANILMWRAVP